MASKRELSCLLLHFSVKQSICFLIADKSKSRISKFGQMIKKEGNNLNQQVCEPFGILKVCPRILCRQLYSLHPLSGSKIVKLTSFLNQNLWLEIANCEILKVCNPENSLDSCTLHLYLQSLSGSKIDLIITIIIMGLNFSLIKRRQTTTRSNWS